VADLAFIVLSLVYFAVSYAYVAGCRRLQGA
jgi:hypothetical protein